jgi:hypothetical protein
LVGFIAASALIISRMTGQILEARSVSCHQGWYFRRLAGVALFAIAAVVLPVAHLLAQAVTPQTAPPPTPSAAAAAAVAPATLVYGNRPITEFRAIVLTRTPAQRVAGAVARLDGAIAANSPGSVTSQTVEGVKVVLVDGQTMFATVPEDVDELAGETLVVSYPYLPGSESEAFKGVSVFVGLIISLGSSGIVNQMMSGCTITCSRALRVGDFVRIGDVEGTVLRSWFPPSRRITRGLPIPRARSSPRK